jgi:hypothetical protein
MKHNSISRIFALSLIAVLPFQAMAQCNAFVKKKCMAKISPFTHNGQMNVSTLAAGQSSDISLTFYSGQAYRILVCSEEILGDVTFQVMDMTKKIVFDSRNNNYPDFWDFKVKNTQQFIVHVQTPPSNSSSSIPPSGCVSILVGFKKS